MTSPGPLAVFGMGVVSSLGPCMTTRLGVLGGLLRGTRGRRRAVISAAFLSGILLASLALTASAAFLRHAVAAATLVYVAIAVLLAYSGVKTILDSSSNRGCGHERICISYGSSLLTGLGLGLVISPCCTPVFGALALAAATATPWASLGTATAFALGHAMPLLVGTVPYHALEHAAENRSWWAVQTVAGGVMIALGAYYGMLA